MHVEGDRLFAARRRQVRGLRNDVRGASDQQGNRGGLDPRRHVQLSSVRSAKQAVKATGMFSINGLLDAARPSFRYGKMARLGFEVGRRHL
jgi:hypothetical protein